MPGPPPKRSEERIRHNDPAGGPQRRVEITEVTAAATAEELANLPLAMKIRQPVTVPEPCENWHDLVKDLWESAQRSGAAVYYEPADWHLLRVTCESLSREFEDKPVVIGMGENREVEWVPLPIKGASLTAYTKILGMLGFTEAERRRMGIEVARSQVDVSGRGDGKPGRDATVTTLATKRASRLA